MRQMFNEPSLPLIIEGERGRMRRISSILGDFMGRMFTAGEGAGLAQSEWDAESNEGADSW